MYKINLANLSRATAQEVFDQVVTHLRHQKVQSVSDDHMGMCMYRDGKGNMCAAGCLISDDEYNIRFDTDIDGTIGVGWRDLIERRVVLSTHDRLISKLQNIHDSCNDIDEWEKRFEYIAIEFNLNFVKQGEV